ncbi:CaiB/BaiF CoA-transferase family protein [Gordonibacter sp. 28C]|uniref:CaiB/BaiF CoA transferase family protein n=1 Tax=Gordonibacter sp. 28C TaxID=2078569 RepID=UPI001314DE8E|nr:CoA transferase [Gordonibacter sp. 28C]
MESALQGLRAIEFGEGEGLALAGRYLAELGVEVIKVEGPKGDGLRRIPPVLKPSKDGEVGTSYLFEMLNVGKRSITLDVRKMEDNDKLIKLIESADFFIEAHQRLDTVVELGLDYPTISEMCPELIYTSISGFGVNSAYANKPWSDIAIQARGGSMYMMGYESDPPTKSGASYSEYVLALDAALGSVMAYYSRLDSGEGQLVEVSAMDSFDFTNGNTWQWMLAKGTRPLRSGTSHPTSTPYGVFPTKDGYIATGVSGNPQWALMCKCMNREDLIDDPRTAEVYDRINNYQDFTNQQVIDWMADKTNEELVPMLTEYKLAAGSVNYIDQVVNDEQLIGRGMITKFATDEGEVYLPGSMFSLSETPGVVRGPAPKFAEAKAEDFFGNHVPVVPAEKHPKRPGEGPLSGLNVLNFGRYLAAPLLGVYLAAYGANVVKVEPPAGDAITLQPPYVEGGTRNYIFHLLDAGMGCMSLNLAHEDAQQIVHDLVKSTFDVVIENNSTSVMTKYHCTYRELKEENPALIYASLSGYGQTGPKSHLLAMDQQVQCESGLLSLSGWEKGKFTRTADSFSDTVTPRVAMIGILSALCYRRKTGKGQYMDAAMQDVDTFLTYSAWPAWFTEGKVLSHYGNTYPFAVAYNGYHALDDMVVIGVMSDDQWLALLDVMGPAADGLRAVIEKPSDRFAHREMIDDAIGSWVADKKAQDVADLCDEHGVPAAVPVDLVAHLNDEAFADREMHLEFIHPIPGLGPVYTLNTPVKLSKTPGRVKKPAPELGEDTGKILIGMMGKSQEEFSRLRNENAVL